MQAALPHNYMLALHGLCMTLPRLATLCRALPAFAALCPPLPALLAFAKHIDQDKCKKQMEVECANLGFLNLG